MSEPVNEVQHSVKPGTKVSGGSLMKRYLFRLWWAPVSLALGVFVFSSPAVFAAQNAPPIQCFKFGPAESAAKTSFLDFRPLSSQTVYSGQGGCGWSDIAWLRDFKEEKSMAGDPLCGAYTFVVGNHKTELKADVPNGDYLVAIWSGRMWRGDSLNPYVMGEESYGSWSISAEGEIKKEVKTDGKTWMKDVYCCNVASDYQGGDVWQKYMASRYGPVVFPAKVADGQLNIGFAITVPDTALWRKYTKSIWMAGGDILPVNGIVICPKERETEFRALLERVAQEQRTAFYKKFSPPREVKAALDDAGGGNVKDYLVFAAHFMKGIYPDTKPADDSETTCIENIGMTDTYGQRCLERMVSFGKDTIDKPLSAVAAPDEYAPVAFGIWPARELKGVRVEAGALTCGKDLIEKGNVRIDLVRYGVFGTDPSGNFSDSLSVQPQYLYPLAAPLDIAAGFTRSFQVTVHVPPSANPGIYSGTVRVSCSNASARTIALKIRVLPFRPDPLDKLVFGVNSFAAGAGYLLGFPDQEETFWKYAEEGCRDMKRYGFTTVDIYIAHTDVSVNLKEKKIIFHPEYLARSLAIVKKMDFPCKQVVICFTHPFGDAFMHQHYGTVDLNDPAWQKEIVGFMKEVSRMAEREGLTAVLDIQSEPTNQSRERFDNSLAVYKMVKEQAPEVKLYCAHCSDFSFEGVLYPYCDYNGLHNSPEVTKQKVVEAGTEHTKNSYFLYNANGHPRLSYGFFPWATGAIGRGQEFYMYALGDPYNCLDGSGPDGFISATLPGPDGPVALTCSEDLRQGLYDWRYLITLERLISETRKRGKTEEAETSAKALAWIRNQINPDFAYYLRVGFPTGETLDKLRWKAAREIMRLNEVLQTP